MLSYKVILKTTNKHAHRVESCVNTWLQGLDYVCLTDTPTGRFPEIQGSTREDYYSAEEKTLHLINLVRETDAFDQYDWLAFIDDDAVLNVRKFKYALPFFDKTKVYGLMMRGSFSQEPELLYPSGGSGYFISPSLIKRCKPMTNKEWGIEDAAIGKWMEENGIELVDHYKLGKHWYSLTLNGWFSFQHEYNQLTSEELHDPELYGRRIIEVMDDIEAKRKDIRRYMTQHYVRNPKLMEFVHNTFKEWSPMYL